MGNIVAIVGRPNVGKSTLFNRITESRKAIVDQIAGVTRDRHYGKGDWNGKEFSIIDTGGYIHGSEDVFEDEIRKQVEIAIAESNALLFVVDVTEGITQLDEEVAEVLRRSKKPVFVVVNKVDNNERYEPANEFYSLGLGEIYQVSSINGHGTGDLLDALVDSFTEDVAEELPDIPKVAIVGRPNVGKSSFVNALLDEERNIVTPIAGTTRDTLHTRFNKFGFDFLLIDTAGLRKKAKVHEDLEFYSVMRTVKAIEDCDVCVLMLDATLGFESQDMNIFSLAQKNRKGIVIMVNKWDLMEKETNTSRDFEESLRSQLMPFKDVPIIFASAETKQRILKVMESVQHVYNNKIKKIKTRELNDVMLPLIENFPPAAVKGKFIRIKFCTQLPTKNPNFVFYCNLPQYVTESYGRFLENKMREKFDFTGVPIEIFFRKK